MLITFDSIMILIWNF